MNPGNPWLRFVFGIVAVAVAIRLTFELLQPVVPVLVVLLVALGIVRAFVWYRGRW